MQTLWNRIKQQRTDMEKLIQYEILQSGVQNTIEQLETAKQLLLFNVPESLVRETIINHLDGILVGLRYRECVLIDKETGEIL